LPYNLITADMRSGYVDLIEAVRKRGDRVDPRGQRTLELSDVSITLTNPERAIPYDVGRKLHMPIASAEFVQLVGGYSDAQQLESISPVFKTFTDGGRLRGAYGPRLHSQWPHLLQRLTADPSTRQAVATIWRADELTSDSHDVPCTISLSYTIRDGALDARTHMRSNDLWLGTPYDFGQFTALHRTLAWVLGVQVGTYTHFVNSLHLYERDLDAADEIEFTHAFQRDLMPPITFKTDEKIDTLTRWHLVQSLARRIAIGDALAGLGVIHFDRLKAHASRLPICHICRYAYEPDPERSYLNVCDECIK
jgi:thymidylate synthase